MRPTSVILTALAIGFAAPVLAQDSAPVGDLESIDTPPGAAAPATNPPPAPAPGLSGTGALSGTAQPPAADGSGPAEGQRYALQTHNDWIIRCLRVSEGDDPCEMHQILTDQGGVQTAEISIFPVNQGEAVAGATIITPLNTQLPQGVTLAIDDGPTARYPFLFCNRIGCFSQFGLSADDVSTLKRGVSGALRVASMAAPQEPVTLTVSLSGFTAAYDMLVERAGQ